MLVTLAKLCGMLGTLSSITQLDSTLSGKCGCGMNTTLTKRILDTPGLLPPKIEDQEAAKNLAYTGAIKDEIMNIELLSYSLLDYLRDNYSEVLCQRYKLTDDISGMQGYEILEYIGKKRGFFISGGEIDMERASNMVIDEFRSCRIGNITLEKPQND